MKSVVRQGHCFCKDVLLFGFFKFSMLWAPQIHSFTATFIRVMEENSDTYLGEEDIKAFRKKS